MSVNLINPCKNESPWCNPFEFHGRVLQPFSIEVLPKLNFDSARLRRLLPGKTKVFIPHLPKTTLEAILDTVRGLKVAGFEPIPHIAARRIASSLELKMLITALHGLGVKELLLVAGSNDKPLGEYKQCIDLLNSEIFEQFRFKRLLFAGHPEGHPYVDREQIEAALLKKIRMATQKGYETTVVTQFCFNIQAISQWLRRIRNTGVIVPIYVGITGPASFNTLLRYAAICGVSASANQFFIQPLQMWQLFYKGNADYFIDTLMKQPEIGAQIAGFHLFPFGGVDKTIQWVEKFSSSKRIR